MNTHLAPYQKLLSRSIVFLLLAWLGLSPMGVAAESKIPPLRELPTELATANKQLTQWRAALQKERNQLRERTQQHNAKCRSVEEGSPAQAPCTQALATLTTEVEQHVQESTLFNRNVMTIGAMTAYANRKEWSSDERKRLKLAFNSLQNDGNPDTGQAAIKRTWETILARGHGEEFKRLAEGGQGPGMPGAGTQTQHQDCAVFALAKAANLPYGVVAARATELIGDATWRPAAERAHPQKTIENRGLNGGEVIILAEAFGQVEVVSSANFPKTLKDGRPVMANLVPADGDVTSGHQVVLTRTFQRAGETWYEMMDSNQGPLRRLYLSDAELKTVLQENGIAYRPERDKTPMLFR